MSKKRILAINPGSTSTKIAIFEDNSCVYKQSLDHASEDLAKYDSIFSQFDFRLRLVEAALDRAGVELETLDAVIGRGGLLRPIASGVYPVNQSMLDELSAALNGEHASNLGALLAHAVAHRATEGSGRPIPAYIADPVVVDELEPVARVSGIPQCQRVSIFHALNHKAVAREYARREQREYESLNLIVAHMGGGVSVAAHRKGRVVDVNNALDGEGPFSPERAGSLPTGQLVDLCFSGEYTRQQMRRLICGAGGFVAHTGSNDARVTENAAAAGDPKALLIQNAFCYQVAKWIGAMAAVLEGKVDAILLTGGMAYGKAIVQEIDRQVNFIAPVHIFPGEDEMAALAHNALAALNGTLKPQEY